MDPLKIKTLRIKNLPELLQHAICSFHIASTCKDDLPDTYSVGVLAKMNGSSLRDQKTARGSTAYDHRQAQVLSYFQRTAVE